MDESLVGLEPEIVWKYFDRLRQIPRCSKKEEKAVKFAEDVANELGLEHRTDDTGNVVIVKPPSPGYEDHDPVCLQSHLDMVCEKNSDVDHDFSKDPVKLKRDGEYLTARGTTLGADNGIGVAVAMALAESKDIKAPKLELLFTVDEETGMTGAFALSEDFLESRRFINLDSEELGSIYVGCAGGGDTSLTLPLGSTCQKEGKKGLKVEVKGLKGGHSGVDIHLGRANAIKCLARSLWKVAQDQELHLYDIQGGNKRNAIPREASAEVLLDDTEKARKVFDKVQEELRDEYEGIEEGIKIICKDIDKDRAYSKESTNKLLSLLYSVPHGYLALNPYIDDLVDTSTNLATITMEGDNARIGTSSRSSITSARDSVRDMLTALGELAGAEVKKGGSYPSWKPNMDSKILKKAKEVYINEFGEEPEIKAIHAGLEPAIISKHFPGMDMVSIGPQIEYPHSPDERVEIKSVKVIWDYLAALLKEL